jgi:lipopolysaccharide assembly protein A
MRWLYLAVVTLFAVLTAIFAFQNLERVTMSFLGFNLSTPLAVLAVVVYVLGAFTGGGLFGLLRRSYTGAKSRSG